MRVTGGTLRGRLLKVPKGDAVRPTQDMVRQALFSSFATLVPGCRFLDLFAGSGAVGLEAWSRGASFVCWVESDPRVFRVLRENIDALCGPNGPEAVQSGRRVERCEVFRFLRGEPGGADYDLVFADPPYDRDGSEQWATRLLDMLAQGRLLTEQGFFVMEQASDELEPVAPLWDTLAVKTYGGTRVTVYRKKAL